MRLLRSAPPWTVLGLGLAGATAFTATCADDEVSPVPLPAAVCLEPRSAPLGEVPTGCDLAVEPSDDDLGALQGALTDAWPGATVCLGAGTYSLSVELSLTTSDVTVRGAGQGETILDFAGQDLGANGWSIAGDRAVIEGLTVKNTAGDGIRATGVTDVTFRDVGVVWDADASKENGAYGLYPVGCDGVLIEGCLVKGARDAGIYVGQSTRILITDSEAYGNVAGIEIENSTQAEVVGNHAHDNTAGILVFNLPGLPVQGGREAKVHGNVVEDNNLDNFAAGGIVAFVPAGVGVLVLASDDNEFADNTITGNVSSAVLIVSYIEGLFGIANDPAYDLYSEGNWIHDNVIEDNGTDPQGIAGDLLGDPPVAELQVDGCYDAASPGPKNCFSDNGASVGYVNADLCGLGADTLADVTCTYDALPAVDPGFAAPIQGEPPTGDVACQALSGYHLFDGPPSALVPSPGGHRYEVASPLWSDDAGKARTIVLPEGATIGLSDTGSWQFPEGTIVTKTFYFPADYREPDGAKRLVETRLLIRDGGQWRAESYLWNEAQTDAVRAPGGARVEVSYVDRSGEPRTEDYVVPSTGLCANCHVRMDEMTLLGVETAQMNRVVTSGGKAVNQLTLFAQQGMFDADVDPATLDALVSPADEDASIDDRVRGYLHANCAHCHSAGGAAESSGLFLHYTETDLAKRGVCKIPAAAGAGTGGLQFDVVPGAPDESILLFRMQSSEPAVKMPEVPNRLVDEAGVALLEEWIAGLTPAGCE